MLEQNKNQVNVGSIVQINIGFIDEKFKCCLVVVDEVKGWGVSGYIIIPGKGNAYIRLDYKDIELVGECKWMVE